MDVDDDDDEDEDDDNEDDDDTEEAPGELSRMPASSSNSPAFRFLGVMEELCRE